MKKIIVFFVMIITITVLFFFYKSKSIITPVPQGSGVQLILVSPTIHINN